MKNRKFLGPNISLVIGTLALIAGLSQASSTLFAGIYIILGALAYKSAKKRKIGLAGTSTKRLIFELIGIALIVAMTLLTSRIMLIEDPFPNLVIPAWAIIAYILINLKGGKTVTVENTTELTNV